MKAVDNRCSGCGANLTQNQNHSRGCQYGPKQSKQSKEVGRIVVLNELPDATHWEVIEVDHAHSMFLVRERNTDYRPQWIHTCQVFKYIWD